MHGDKPNELKRWRANLKDPEWQAAIADLVNGRHETEELFRKVEKFTGVALPDEMVEKMYYVGDLMGIDIEQMGYGELAHTLNIWLDRKRIEAAVAASVPNGKHSNAIPEIDAVDADDVAILQVLAKRETMYLTNQQIAGQAHRGEKLVRTRIGSLLSKNLIVRHPGKPKKGGVTITAKGKKILKSHAGN